MITKEKALRKEHIANTYMSWEKFPTFLILTHWSHANYKDILHALNVYKTAAKEHQVVNRWAAHEIPDSEILFWKYLQNIPLTSCNYKRLKRTKIAIFIISCFLSAQNVLVTTAE